LCASAAQLSAAAIPAVSGQLMRAFRARSG